MHIIKVRNGKKFEQEAIIEGAKEMGLKKGIEQSKIAIAKNLLKMEMPIKEIVKATELNEEIILRIKKDHMTD